MERCLTSLIINRTSNQNYNEIPPYTNGYCGWKGGSVVKFTSAMMESNLTGWPDYKFLIGPWLMWIHRLSAGQQNERYTHTHTHTHTYVYVYIYIFILTWGYAYWFLERERNIYVREKHWSVASHTCPNWGLNLQPQACTLTRNWTVNLSVYRTMLQPTETHQPGQDILYKMWIW